ncbi:hypothetical protein QML00_28800, partial [Klebsiella pneumoniae]|uniref:hypothetical protein n=1 Tax=Klebsiella pneumoniae TaxID=573 RepID=UPI003A8A6B32
ELWRFSIEKQKEKVVSHTWKHQARCSSFTPEGLGGAPAVRQDEAFELEAWHSVPKMRPNWHFLPVSVIQSDFLKCFNSS